VRCGNNLEEAAAAVADGGIIAYPTEGVFGLGCNPTLEHVVEQLLQLKVRAAEKGLILLAADRHQLDPYIDNVVPSIERKLSDSWPGPVTWILPAATGTSDLLTGGRSTIAARVTAFSTAARLCKLCGHALISTSANRSGHSPCITAPEVMAEFEELDYVVDYPVGSLQGPTPIYDGATGKQLR
jgi:L-threonylcarbamoyladenylate synthase